MILMLMLLKYFKNTCCVRKLNIVQIGDKLGSCRFNTEVHSDFNVLFNTTECCCFYLCLLNVVIQKHYVRQKQNEGVSFEISASTFDVF